MTSPYDIDEIFPDDAADAVRLPRRQAGNSPQDLTVTLLADYTLSTRAELPSAAIVALLAEAGVSPAGARTAISRLARRRVLQVRRQGRRSAYRLTPEAADFLAVGGSWIASAATGAEPWDEHWTLIAFSLPQTERAQRQELRNRLRWMGYAPLYDGLWISPHDLTEKARKRFALIAPGALTVFRARHVELGAGLDRNPVQAWDIAAIAREYERFLERWRHVPARIAGGQPAGAEAVRFRTEVMDTFRRLPILDPRLPLRLLPAGWPRQPARDLFVAVYDGLAGTAQEHVRAVAAGVTDGPLTGIRAHTVDDLSAGLPPDSANFGD
ncbi:PaaX family transcriptional regulator [Paractinoplanes atraurantiacus]|uniref:Phenylacetic acid degradation operon negative regulatory protein n=1 Tax=Paractinoplanes atraurantiacus TaxID=1036182 RepID=A0A285GNF3_9ACTN|nr:PaaX family transcriptional regulator C-terminal domain-containing protein [Actinoplanes atraurantiacus]SNY25160.1 phenylacetic acid degradation operon negative regulatory protein [Actinoplanes atraurantiacus]